jgi:acyl-coenzyme A synthetase/AMP-(fatty) acid ligase
MALPPLQAVISATAPLDPALAETAERCWSAPVLEIFGATEVGSIASRRTVAGSAWTTYDGIRLLPAGTDQVLVATPHAEPHPLADRLEALSPTEFRLLGRNADMVKLGGRRASLGGLNAILLSLPGVQDGVFIAPDDLDQRPGARLLAFAVAPDVSSEDILSALRERIEPVFLPRRVIRLGALPRNEAGKIPRAALLELLARDAALR